MRALYHEPCGAQVFPRRAEHYQVIHIAAHGIFDDVSPMQ